MVTGEKEKKAVCERCGKCCTMEIPLTLLDIYRIAVFRRLGAREVFRETVAETVSPHTRLYMLRKRGDGACRFLDRDGGCDVHPAKPNICRFYHCGSATGKRVMLWTATCRLPVQRAELWEQSIAMEVTRAYIEKNDARWNEADFHAALDGIFEQIPARDTEKLKLSRGSDGAAMAMLYDCTRCEKRGTFARETPVTLDDIRRISAWMGVGWKAFFETYVADEPSEYTGGLKLKRDSHCIFFDPEIHCRIREVKPLHCRFTPCPKRVRTPEMMDALYLGSGTLDEQFRHQVAMAVTRGYVRGQGTCFGKAPMEAALRKMGEMEAAPDELREFSRQIARFRYVDDTPAFLETLSGGDPADRDGGGRRSGEKKYFQHPQR